MKIFLDTSALAKRYVQEPGSEALENLFSAGVSEVYVSTLALPEFGAALSRKLRDKELAKKSAEYALREFEKDWDNVFTKVPLTDAVAKSATSLAIQHPLKGADAVHLAAAMAADVGLLVASDQQMIKTARKVGLKAYDLKEGL